MSYQVTLARNAVLPVSVPPDQAVPHGAMVVVETEDGLEVGKIKKHGSLVAAQWAKQPQDKRVMWVKTLSPQEYPLLDELKRLEAEALTKCKELIKGHSLSMHLVSAHYTFDQKKVTFYYTSPQRVDFRELLKDLTQAFRRTRINLRHIGARDETALLGGVGPCGQVLCCSSFLREFKPININLAKQQYLPLNPQKITGNCGRLMCCLHYEYETYVSISKTMPALGAGVSTPDGRGRVVGVHILKKALTVLLESSESKQFDAPLVQALPAGETVNVVLPAWLQASLDTAGDVPPEIASTLQG